MITPSEAVVVGCSVTDNVPSAEVTVSLENHGSNAAKLILNYEGSTFEEIIPVEGSLDLEKGKNRSSIRLDDIVLKHKEAFLPQPGGCGFNSAMEVGKLGRRYRFPVISLDITEITDSVTQALGSQNIAHESINAMEMLQNILITGNSGNGRVIFASPYFYRQKTERRYGAVSRTLSKAGAMLINSGKDSDVLSMVVNEGRKYNVGMFFALTDRQPLGIIREVVIPYGDLVFEINELSRLLQESVPEGSANKYSRGKQCAKAVRKMQLAEKHDIYVTMGKDGLMGIGQDYCFWVNLQGQAYESIQKKIENNPLLENATGDKIAAYLFVAGHLPSIYKRGGLAKRDPIDAAMTALKLLAKEHFGCQTPLSESNFFVHTELVR